MSQLIMITYWAVSLILMAFAAIVIYKLARVDLSGLICEIKEGGAEAGKASLSRFQFLLFTFVVAGIYLTLCLESGTFVDIPNGTLALIGISGGSYVLSKTVSGAKPANGGTGQPGKTTKTTKTTKTGSS